MSLKTQVDHLFKVSNLSIKDIAITLGISEWSVVNLIDYGQKK